MWNPLRKKPKTEVLLPVVKKVQWRNNMWVVTEDGVGILFDYGPVDSVVHLVNPDGTTKESKTYKSLMLRQAKWNEIPQNRRGVDRTTANYLGYE